MAYNPEGLKLYLTLGVSKHRLTHFQLQHISHLLVWLELYSQRSLL